MKYSEIRRFFKTSRNLTNVRNITNSVMAGGASHWPWSLENSGILEQAEDACRYLRRRPRALRRKE